MKKLIALALAIIMLFALAACGSSSGTVTTNTATKSEEKTPSDDNSDTAATETKAKPAPASDGSAVSGEVSFATWGSLDEKKVNEEIITAFEAKYPGTKIKLEYIPEEYVQKIDTMFMGGNAPDVLYGHPHTFANWAEKGLLMDLTDKFNEESDFYFNEKFAQNVYDAFRWNGRYIATINGHDTYLLYYNLDLFDEAGISYPTDEWTWNDFMDAAKKLTKDVDGGKQYGFTVSAWPPDLFPFIYSFGGDVFDDMNAPTKVVFNSPETVEGLRFIQDMVVTNQVAPNYQQSELVGGSFDTGRVAMDITGCWSPAFRKNITDFRWDMANLPLAPGKDRRTSALFAGYAINASTKNFDLAYEYAKFYQDDEGQNILSKLGLITVINKDVANKEENLRTPGMPEHIDLRVSSISYATNGYGFTTNWQEMAEKALKPHFDSLVSGAITPEQCAENVQKGLEPLLEAAKAKQ